MCLPHIWLQREKSGRRWMCSDRPGAARRLVTFLAPVLPVPVRRLRNSTWQGTQNVPCHGTRTVLADIPLPGRAARRASRGERAKALPLVFTYGQRPVSSEVGQSLTPYLRTFPSTQHSVPSTVLSPLLSPQHLWATPGYGGACAPCVIPLGNPGWGHGFTRVICRKTLLFSTYCGGMSNRSTCPADVSINREHFDIWSGRLRTQSKSPLEQKAARGAAAARKKAETPQCCC
jgi:hypothetical protein